VDNTPESVSTEALGTAVQDVPQEADAVLEVSGAIAVQISHVSGEVSTVADRLVSDAKAQLRQGAETQLGQVADGLDRLRNQTRALAEGRPDEAGPLLDYVQDGADLLGDLADHIHDGGLDGVVVDIKRFARARPVVFLAGSAFAGLAVGRLLKNEAAVAQARLQQSESTVDDTDGGSAEPSGAPAPGSASASAPVADPAP
jgi:hypothetical protein